MKKINLLWAGVLLSLSISALSQAQDKSHPDISFAPMGKALNLRQHVDGRLEVLNYHFYAELFLKPDGQVSGAILRGNGKDTPFEVNGTTLKVKGERNKSKQEMDDKFADGEYHYIFKTKDGKDHDLKFVVGGENGERPIPDAIKISYRQGGLAVLQNNINPNKDLTISWTPFHQGRADPNGIIDDMIFVSVTDCFGHKIDHSGTAFTERGALTYRENQYVVRATSLEPGLIYPIFVEHVIADTMDENGIRGMVANATTTFADLKTTGEHTGKACPVIIPQMEPGQTDRPSIYIE